MRAFDQDFGTLFNSLGWNDLFDRGGAALRPGAQEILAARGGERDFAEQRGLSGAVSAQNPLPPAADIPGTTGTTATITSGGLVVGSLESKGDHDWFKITLTAGQHVTLLLSGFGPGGLDDPLINLRSSAGAVLATNDDIESGVQRDSRLEFTATTAGTYYIDAGAYADDYTGAYVLQVFDSESTADTILPTRSTTARMEFGGNYNGVIEVGHDHDWIAIDLVAGQEYVVRVNGDGTSPLANPILGVRGPSGNIIGQNDNTYGLNPEVTFTAAVTGTYYIDVGSSGDVGKGEYTVSVTKALEVFTFDQIATQLTETYWGGSQHAFVIGNDNALTVDISALPQNVQVIARAALQTWADVLGINFVAQVGGAEITFKDDEEGAFAESTYAAGGSILRSTVNVDTAWVADYGTSLDSYTMQTYIHEIGHALGLGHAGEYNGSADYPIDASYLNDAWSTSVMSYFSPRENDYFYQQGFTTHFLATPMNSDVVAVADLYGLSTTTRTGNTVYGFGSTAGAPIFNSPAYPDVAYCIFDSGGVDWLNYSGFSNNQTIDLLPEQFMNIGAGIGNVMIARGTFIENARGGSGNDVINGNHGNNTLLGHEGADRMAGRAGNDVMLGGVGNDLLWGGLGDDTLQGEDGDDRLEGDGGNDYLFGGLGFDVLSGSAGNDGARGGDGGDILLGGSGDDTLYGDAGDDLLFGGDQRDYLEGGAGNDTLSGGTGLDVLVGGSGADRFIIDGPPNALTTSDIRDFEHLIDKICLDRAILTGMGAVGGLAASAFATGWSARDADDRIIYHAASGQIFYDPDGLGGIGQARIAVVTPGTVLTAADFAIISSASSAAEAIKPVAADPYDPGADLFGF